MEKLNQVRQEVQKRIFGYIAAGLGFVTGLAWNDAIKLLLETLFPISKNAILAKFFYAIFLTVSVGVVLVYLEKLLRRMHEGEKKENPAER